MTNDAPPEKPPAPDDNSAKPYTRRVLGKIGAALGWFATNAGFSPLSLIIGVLALFGTIFINNWSEAIKRSEERQFQAIRQITIPAANFVAEINPLPVLVHLDATSIEANARVIKGKIHISEFEAAYWSEVALVVDEGLAFRSTLLRNTLKNWSGEIERSAVYADQIRHQLERLAAVVRCRSNYVKQNPFSAIRFHIFGYPDHCHNPGTQPE